MSFLRIKRTKHKGLAVNNTAPLPWYKQAMNASSASIGARLTHEEKMRLVVEEIKFHERRLGCCK
jgi:hypothetical protein